MSGTFVIGDVHGCAGELDRLLRKVHPERVILVGDLFTKGPDPRGVWSLIKEWGAEAVMGNHDSEVLMQWTPGVDLPRKAFRWLRALPTMIEGKDWVTVHAGVNPRNWRKTLAWEAMHLREWGGTGMPWWKLYQGRRLVLHGHDASRGLIDRRPNTLGLDTACARGGRLTGYLVEDDEVVSVRSRVPTR